MILDLHYTIRVSVEDSKELMDRVLTPISDAIEKAGGHIKENGFLKVEDEGKVIGFKGE